MDPNALIHRFRHTPDAIAALTADVGDTFARWRPRPDQWSVLEVVCHLADEESRDFRTRLDLTLHSPGQAWPAIDPERWVEDEAYRDRALPDEVERFREERARSVMWLEGLVEPDWSRSYPLGEMGKLSAEDLLGSWLAHDLIHIRQITRLHRQYLETSLAPHARLEYAGRW